MDLILGRHALQMAKPVLSVELTITSPESALRQAPHNKNNHENLPNFKLRAGVETTEHLMGGPNRDPLVTKAYVCGRAHAQDSSNHQLFLFFQRRGDVGPSLIPRPSLRETTSGLAGSCCYVVSKPSCMVDRRNKDCVFIELRTHSSVGRALHR